MFDNERTCIQEAELREAKIGLCIQSLQLRVRPKEPYAQGADQGKFQDRHRPGVPFPRKADLTPPVNSHGFTYRALLLCFPCHVPPPTAQNATDVTLGEMGIFERLLLICDGHPVHKAKVVREWLNNHKERITQKVLPSYSPELNPDEFLNPDVKTNAVRRNRPRNQQELLWNVRSYLQSTQRQPAVVSNFFLAPSIQYASIEGKHSNNCAAG